MVCNGDELANLSFKIYSSVSATAAAFLPGLSLKLNAGHSSSSHFEGIEWGGKTLSHLLHRETIGMKRMCLFALRLPLR